MDDTKVIEFLCLVPIYEEEFNYKTALGADALVEAFKKENISQVLDMKRKNSCEHIEVEDIAASLFLWEENNQNN